MKTILLPFIALVLSSGAILAQDSLNVAPSQIALSITEKLDHEVTLSESQKKEVYALLLERSEKFGRARNGRNPNAEKVYQEANQAAMNRLRKVFTEEQLKKFNDIRKEDRAQKEKHPKSKHDRYGQDIELEF